MWARQVRNRGRLRLPLRPQSRFRRPRTDERTEEHTKEYSKYSESREIVVLWGWWKDAIPACLSVCLFSSSMFGAWHSPKLQRGLRLTSQRMGPTGCCCARRPRPSGIAGAGESTLHARAARELVFLGSCPDPVDPAPSVGLAGGPEETKGGKHHRATDEIRCSFRGCRGRTVRHPQTPDSSLGRSSPMLSTCAPLHVKT